MTRSSHIVAKLATLGPSLLNYHGNCQIGNSAGCHIDFALHSYCDIGTDCFARWKLIRNYFVAVRPRNAWERDFTSMKRCRSLRSSARAIIGHRKTKRAGRNRRRNRIENLHYPIYSNNKRLCVWTNVFACLRACMKLDRRRNCTPNLNSCEGSIRKHCRWATRAWAQ